MMRKVIALATGAIAASALVLGVAGTALASQTSLGPQELQPCVTNGLNVDFDTAYNNGAYNVTAVKVSGIPAECSGQQLAANLVDQNNNSLGTSEVTIPDKATAVTVPIAEVLVTEFNRVEVLILG